MSTQANGLTPAMETADGRTIWTRLGFDGTKHGGGRGWEVYVDGEAGPERVCSVTVERPGFSGTGPFTPKVNWSAWGLQSVEMTRRVAEALQFAANFAHDECINLQAEVG